MTTEEIKEDMINIETVQIAINDKLHRIQEIQDNLQKRVDRLREAVSHEFNPD